MTHRGGCGCTIKGRDSFKWESHLITLMFWEDHPWGQAAGRETSGGRLQKSPRPDGWWLDWDGGLEGERKWIVFRNTQAGKIERLPLAQRRRAGELGMTP